MLTNCFENTNNILFTRHLEKNEDLLLQTNCYLSHKQFVLNQGVCPEPPTPIKKSFCLQTFHKIQSWEKTNFSHNSILMKIDPSQKETISVKNSKIFPLFTWKLFSNFNLMEPQMNCKFYSYFDTCKISLSFSSQAKMNNRKFSVFFFLVILPVVFGIYFVARASFHI